MGGKFINLVTKLMSCPSINFFLMFELMINYYEWCDWIFCIIYP